ETSDESETKASNPDDVPVTPIALNASTATVGSTHKLERSTLAEGANQQSLAAHRASSGINNTDPSGKSSLSQAGPAGTTAYIGDGVTVIAGDSVGVRAKERIEFTSFAGTASVGAVGIGAGVSIVTIGSKVDAYIGDATIVAGSDPSDKFGP